MKKYVKPELYYENFELSQHIAACNITMNNTEEMMCTGSGTITNYDSSIDGFPVESFFVDQNNNCGITIDGYCYTNAAEITATINS